MTVAVTPDGTGTGFLPTRDMSLSSGSEHLAEHFTADVTLARNVIGHDALRGRDDGDAEAIGDARQLANGRVDTAAGLRHPLDLPDDRATVVVLEFDLELRAAVAEVLHRVVADVALGLQHVENRGAQARAGGLDDVAATALTVADAGEHITHGIVHHGCLPLPAGLHEAGDETPVAELAQSYA
ncbi:protein of unknown function [Methylorubrum extorquens]|uniref:Uncharacterized protein n=1 Tax=Methylorubrum extorquens TaxID=408 RepID=A0A2N9ASI1_METEX|nr:protein of unknown function [Methylorubrum extorquens]